MTTSEYLLLYVLVKVLNLDILSALLYISSIFYMGDLITSFKETPLSLLKYEDHRGLEAGQQGLVEVSQVGYKLSSVCGV